MILWTIQDEASYKTLLKKGVYRCDLRSEGLPDFKPAYDWMVAQMIRRIGAKPRGVVYPIWAWFMWTRNCKKPDLGWFIKNCGEKGQRFVRLELEVPDKDVLLSDFDVWHSILNNQLISYSNEEDDELEEQYQTLPEPQRREMKEKNWERVFDVEYVPNNWRGRGESIQATFWELRLEYVRKATPFTSKSPLCDSSGAPLISCTTNSSRKNKGLGILKPRKRVPKPRPKKISAKVNKTRNVAKSVRKRVYQIPDYRGATLRHTDVMLLELLYLNARYRDARSERFSVILPCQSESIFTPEWTLLEKRRASARAIAAWRKQKMAKSEETEREDSPRDGELEKGNEEHEQ